VAWRPGWHLVALSINAIAGFLQLWRDVAGVARRLYTVCWLQSLLPAVMQLRRRSYFCRLSMSAAGCSASIAWRRYWRRVISNAWLAAAGYPLISANQPWRNAMASASAQSCWLAMLPVRQYYFSMQSFTCGYAARRNG